MSEPATKLERDIVFRKLRSKPENKVRSQLAGRWWSCATHSPQDLCCTSQCERPRMASALRLGCLARQNHVCVVLAMCRLQSRVHPRTDAMRPPGPNRSALRITHCYGDSCTGAPCRFASTARRRTRLGRPSPTACSSAWHARACTARSASTSASSGAARGLSLRTCDCLCPELRQC